MTVTDLRGARFCPICGHEHDRRRQCPDRCAGCGQTLDRIDPGCPVCVAALDYLHGGSA